MKRLFISLGAVCLLSASAALVTYLVVGPPDRTVECDPENLTEHHVCLSTVREWPVDEVFWIDARRVEDWKKNGLKDSFHLSDDGSDDQVFECVQLLMDQSKTKVVVYCNQSLCSASESVADRLREFGVDFGFEIFVLEGGFKALQSEKGDQESE